MIWMYTPLIFGTVLHSYIQFLNSSKGSLTHKVWPPDDNLELFYSNLGTYSLSLKPWVDTGKKIRNPELFYIHLLEALTNDSKINMSDLEQLVRLDTRYRIDGINQNLQLYPKVLDLHAVVSAIRSGKPVDQKPVSDPELLIIQAPNMSCENPQRSFFLDERSCKCDLVVMVKSCVACQSERMHARLTYMQKTLWAGFKVDFVFVVGLPFVSNSSSYKVDDVEVPSKQHVKTKTELKQQRQSLFEESRVHNDILVGGFIDSYENLTMKVIFALRWASAFCKRCSPLFMFMDSDVSLIPKNFVKLIQKFSDEAKREMIGGLPYFEPGISRPTGRLEDHRHALAHKHYPWDNPPPYLYGHGYLLGSEKVRDGAIASAYVKSIKLEDVYLGIIWEKLGYKCLKLPGFLLTPSSTPEVASSILASTTFADLHVDWKTGELV
ncbi:unnamed protein product [Calicophoron daubneyi]|uniref:Hexosyltransferase n=1 Tax=Calicophoron daubneyi TaxID=300641 RepID=A0AAV2T589_CALDB